MMIEVAAIFNLAFGVFHLFFWRLLNWSEQLKKVSPVNRAVFQALNICLTFMFFLMAYVFLFHANEVYASTVGKVLLIGMAVFWCLRAVIQIYLFDLSGRIHQFLLFLFIVGIILHIIPLFF